MSEGLAQGLYVVARVGFKSATLGTQGTELTTEPPCQTKSSSSSSLLRVVELCHLSDHQPHRQHPWADAGFEAAWRMVEVIVLGYH